MKKSVGRLSVVSTPEIEAACLKLFPNLKQVFSAGNFIEKFCAENSVRKLSREPFFLVPVSRLEKISWKFLRDRVNEYSRIKEQGKSLSSVGTLTKQDVMVRGEEAKPYPENINGNLYLPIIAFTTSAQGKEFIRIEEVGPNNKYKWKKVYDTAQPHQGDYDYSDKSKDWTIGVGHKIQANEWATYLPKGKSISLSDEEMDALFEKDLKRIEAGVRKALKDARLSQHQFDALIAFSYQNGENRIGGEKYNAPDLRKYIHAGDTVKAAEFIRKFNNKHLDRRGREADMYEKGIYRNKG